MRFRFTINSLGDIPIGNLNGIATYSIGSSVEVADTQLTEEQMAVFLLPVLKAFSVPEELHEAISLYLLEMASDCTVGEYLNFDLTNQNVWLSVEFELSNVNYQGAPYSYQVEVYEDNESHSMFGGLVELPLIKSQLLAHLKTETKLTESELWPEVLAEINTFFDHIPNCNEPGHDLELNPDNYSILIKVEVVPEPEPATTHLH